MARVKLRTAPNRLGRSLGRKPDYKSLSLGRKNLLFSVLHRRELKSETASLTIGRDDDLALHRKAQISMPFHWIYIIVAGATILLFFIGMVTRQQGVAEQQLSVSVTQKLDGIFTGAALSEQTLNVIDLPELDFIFTCENDGATGYQVGKKGSLRSLSLQPFFAPSAVRTPQLVTWTLDFSMPFTIINLLLLGSPSITTFLVYDTDDPQSVQLKDTIVDELPEQFQFQAISTREFELVGNARAPVKLIFLTRIDEDAFRNSLTPAIKNLPDDGVRVLRVELTGCSVTYYTKEGSLLQAEGAVSILGCTGDRNPSFYAALMSDSAESYECGMRKTFKRMTILTDVYAQRAQLMKDSYDPAGVCWFQVRPDVFRQFREHVAACADDVAPACLAGIIGSATELRTQNEQLQNNNCATLY